MPIQIKNIFWNTITVFILKISYSIFAIKNTGNELYLETIDSVVQKREGIPRNNEHIKNQF